MLILIYLGLREREKTFFKNLRSSVGTDHAIIEN